MLCKSDYIKTIKTFCNDKVSVLCKTKSDNIKFKQQRNVVTVRQIWVI